MNIFLSNTDYNLKETVVDKYISKTIIVVFSEA